MAIHLPLSMGLFGAFEKNLLKIPHYTSQAPMARIRRTLGHQTFWSFSLSIFNPNFKIAHGLDILILFVQLSSIHAFHGTG